MSERRRIAAALAACAALCAPGSAVAQASAAELAARIDSLERVARWQRVAVERIDSLERAAVSDVVMDTLRVGPFLLIDRGTADNESVAAAIREAWQLYSPLVGDGAGRLSDAVVTATLPRSFGSGSPPYRFDPMVWGGLDMERAAHAVVTSALTDALPQDIRDWLPGAGVTLEPDYTHAYRELATAYSHTARACLANRDAGCMIALGFADPGSEWEGWYTHDELRAHVAARSGESAAGRACIDGEQREACLHVLHDMGGAQPPLGASTRASLLAYALATGGSGSYDRLFAPAADVGGRIANAAGASLDDVIAGWRDQLVRARPDMHATVIGAGFWTIVWLAALALLAMRSTRWRIG